MIYSENKQTNKKKRSQDDLEPERPQRRLWYAVAVRNIIYGTPESGHAFFRPESIHHARTKWTPKTIFETNQNIFALHSLVKICLCHPFGQFFPFFALFCTCLPQTLGKKRKNAIQANAGSHPNTGLAPCKIYWKMHLLKQTMQRSQNRKKFRRRAEKKKTDYAKKLVVYHVTYNGEMTKKH